MPENSTDPTTITSFMGKLQYITDHRDNRGKKHRLPFVLAAVTIAIMAGRQKVSGIHRYIKNRLPWLREITGHPQAQLISRAQLPRVLAKVDWDEVNTIVESHFGVRVVCQAPGEWAAIDGKTLRGSAGHQERTLLARTHTQAQILAQRRMRGPKNSEITAVRDLLRETGLARGKTTLDALHLNPATTTQINLAGGIYAIQVKDNQRTLRTQLQQHAAQDPPVGTLSTTETGHGRQETRHGTFFAVADLACDTRWAASGFRTLVVLERQTTELSTQKMTQETSYYLSNQALTPEPQAAQNELFQAIRQHWGVESDNWIRDVTFGEDHVKTKDGNQGQVLACLRTLALRWLRQANIQNFQAALDDFADSPPLFAAFLKQAHFL